MIRVGAMMTGVVVLFAVMQSGRGEEPRKATASALDALSVSMGAKPPAAAAIKVSASGHESSRWGDFKPENTMDGDLGATSSWRAEGEGAWIQYDLGGLCRVAGIRIAFVQGDTRTYTYEIQLSADGQEWVSVARKTSSGKTTGFEPTELNGAPARYVRIVGHGGSKEGFENWINLTEVEFALQ